MVAATAAVRYFAKLYYTMVKPDRTTDRYDGWTPRVKANSTYEMDGSIADYTN